MDYKNPYIFSVRTISYPRGLLSVIERRELWSDGFMAAQWIEPHLDKPFQPLCPDEAVIALHGETEVCIGSVGSHKLTTAGQALIVRQEQRCVLTSVENDNALVLVVSDIRLKSEERHLTSTQSGTIDDCKVIDLPHLQSGSIAIFDDRLNPSLPFEVERVFYIYNINNGHLHSGHAHRKEQQAMVAVRGHFDVTLSDGHISKRFTLSQADKALYVPAGIWHSMSAFSPDAVCLTFSSTEFDESDYIREPSLYFPEKNDNAAAD